MGVLDDRAAMQIQNLLICIEMLLASIAHYYIFPYDEWQEGFKREREEIKLRDTLAMKDFYKDLKQMVTRWEVSHHGGIDVETGLDFDSAHGIAENLVAGAESKVESLSREVDSNSPCESDSNGSDSALLGDESQDIVNPMQLQSEET